MKSIWNKMISNSDDVSYKRIGSAFALITVVILAYLATFNHDWTCPEFMFDALCLFAEVGMAGTVIEKIFNKNGNNNQGTL